jgi:hypothetical protein
LPIKVDAIAASLLRAPPAAEVPTPDEHIATRRRTEVAKSSRAEPSVRGPGRAEFTRSYLRRSGNKSLQSGCKMDRRFLHRTMSANADFLRFVMWMERRMDAPHRGRDDRVSPLCGTGWGELVEMICPTGKAEYFCRGGWTGKSLICPSGKSVDVYDQVVTRLRCFP